MQLEIKIDTSCREPKIIIITDEITEEIDDIIKKLSDEMPDVLSGCKDEKYEIIDRDQILRVYSSNKKIFAQTEKGEYILKLRLYEVEARLSGKKFTRISNSEIINLKKVKSFDLSYTGTICVRLTDDSLTYVSRRYVSKIKQILGM